MSPDNEKTATGAGAPAAKAKSIDPAALEMLEVASEMGIDTMFTRVDKVKPCTIGASGACCKLCAMGPCRFTGQDADQKRGVCGATLSTIAARNFARQVAAGAASHSDHGRGIALTLKAVAEEGIEGMAVRDEVKLYRVAEMMGIEAEGKSVSELAGAVADKALAQFGQQTGELVYVSRAPEKRQQIWRDLDIVPRGIDREVVELLHRTHPGTDQEMKSLLKSSMKAALASGWGGSMLATDLQDILFGTPKALRSSANLGVLKADKVNIIIHGHEPVLASLMGQVVQSEEMQKLAESVGAAGIVLAGICCTSNEALMRNGVPPAGNSLHQELAIVTGAVDAMVVDVQCTFQGLADVASHFHTKLIDTSEKAHIAGSTMHVDAEHDPMGAARTIVREAIENFPNRGPVHIPEHSSEIVAGFSHEYIRYMLGGKMRASLRPLNDNVMNGKIRGIAAIVGCNNPRVTQDEGIVQVARELIANDVLVVATGCAAIAGGKHGLLTPETMAFAGEGLREVCETVGISPVLHLGSCVDNSRILTILSEVVAEGGLGEDISEVPAVGICPEWFSEKALEIATYCVASGAYVIFGGVGSTVGASSEVVNWMIDGWEEQVGGKLEFIAQPADIVTATLDHIDKKREALGINVQKDRVLFDMEMRRELGV